MNNIANSAIEMINAQRTSDAQIKARSLILAIENSLTAIKARKEVTDKLTAQMKDLAKDKHSVVEILGVDEASSLSASTVVSTVAELNKEEQDAVAAQVADLHSRISSNNKAIEAEEKNLAELRKKLSEIKVETVTASVLA